MKGFLGTSKTKSAKRGNKMTTKHTPGKWNFEQDGREPYVVCDSYPLGRICTMEGISHESRANARLISAAPEMQRALISFLIELKKIDQKSKKLSCIIMRAEKAIRKSKGI